MRTPYETTNFKFYCDTRERVHQSKVDVAWVMLALSEGQGGGFKLLHDRRGFVLFDVMNDSHDVPDLRLYTDADITAFKNFLVQRSQSEHAG